MARFEIITTPEEQAQVLQILRGLVGQTVAVSTIASKAKLNASRVRYILSDLEEAGKISRIPTRAFNEHYIRYRYDLL